MESIRTLYKIGRGPSSSHTMGPERACKIMKERYPCADEFSVTLYGSLALTGVGHGTDRIIKETFAPIPCTIVIDEKTHTPIHPNTMDVTAREKGVDVATVTFYSIGGGAIEIEGEGKAANAPDVYPLSTFSDIARECKKRNITLYYPPLK